MRTASNVLTHARSFSEACLLILALSCAHLAAAADGATDPVQSDGPYLVPAAESGWDAWSVELTSEGPRRRTQRFKEGATFTVPGVGKLPAFPVKVRKPAALPPDDIALAADSPTFIVADTHGEFEIAVELLQNHRIIGRRLEWTFGRGHLVVLGDVLDRGPNQIEILWLLYALEAQAEQAGGGVHLVLGNHEAMVMGGDMRYLNAKYVRTAQVLGVGSYAELVGPQTLLGQWLRTKPAVVRMGDILFVHGGISPEAAERKLTVPQINRTVRHVLNRAPIEDLALAQLLMGPPGPLWYRGYFPEQRGFTPAGAREIDAIREHFGVETIVVGHTQVETVTPLHDGRVIAVQVYPHRDEASGQAVIEAVRVERGRFFRARVGGDLEPLSGSP